MAIKNVTIGSLKTIPYESSECAAICTEGQLRVEEAPVLPFHVIRKQDLDVVIMQVASLTESVYKRIENAAITDAMLSSNVALLNATQTFTGPITHATVAGTGTIVPAITYTGAAHTALTAGTERFDVNWNSARTVQWAMGALTIQRFLLQQRIFNAPPEGVHLSAEEVVFLKDLLGKYSHILVVGRIYAVLDPDNVAIDSPYPHVVPNKAKKRR